MTLFNSLPKPPPGMTQPRKGEGPQIWGQEVQMSPGMFDRDILRVDNIGDPGMLSVFIGYDVVGASPTYSAIDRVWNGLIGTVEWGIGNAKLSTEFDLSQGCCFTLPTEFLRLRASYQLGAAGDITPTVTVKALASMGNRAPANSSYGNVRRTRFFSLIAGATSPGFEVPKFASVVSIYTQAVPGGTADTPIRFEQTTGGGGGAPRVSLVTERTQAIPIAYGLPFFLITNLLATTQVNVAAVFTLAL